MKVYRIERVGFIQINNETTKKQKNYLPALKSLKKLLQSGFYFAIGGDITANRQSKIEERFMWNTFLMNDFIVSKISDQWIQPIIQGFVSMYSILLNNQKADIILISRRSKYQSGTRYHSRGIDDSGNAANFVETEQIIIFSNFLCSFVAVRGSVPVFWNIEGLNNCIRLTRSNDLTHTAFLKHFNSLKSKYEKIFCVNLMTNSKTQEQQLTDVYEKMIQWNNMNFVRYEFVDFQLICHGTKYEAINPTIRKYNQILESFSFYCENLISNKPIQFQRGVFRINCFDCLDRTNAFMTKLFFAVVENILNNLGFDIKQNQVQDALSLLDDTKKNFNDFVYQFKNQWADNGDCISTLYSGIKSTSSEITREGKSGIKKFINSGMKTLERIYNYNFEDEGKQKSINHLLHGMQKEGYYNEFEIYMKSQEKQYCEYDQVSLMITTWNVGAKEPQTKNMQNTLFNFEQNKPPDLIVCGFQEIVDLNTSNLVIFSHEKVVNFWNQLVAFNLSTTDSYIQVACSNLVGIYVCLYAKRSMIKRISQIETDVVKTGLGGTLGNKGAAVIKIQIDNTQFAFFNCHLSAGQSKINERRQDIQDIHEKTNIKKIMEVDYKFLFGDLNFRVDSNYQQIISMIAYYQQLMEQSQFKQASEVFYSIHDLDQLSKVRPRDAYLSKYQEGGITFLPTYKFNPGTNVYDTSKKQRVPSWCDRIMLSCSDDNVYQQAFYNRREISESDHKPVASYYIVQVKKIDKEKLEEVKKSFADVILSFDDNDNLNLNQCIPDEAIFDQNTAEQQQTTLKQSSRSSSTPKQMNMTLFQRKQIQVEPLINQTAKTYQGRRIALPPPELLQSLSQMKHFQPLSFQQQPQKQASVESPLINLLEKDSNNNPNHIDLL